MFRYLLLILYFFYSSVDGFSQNLNKIKNDIQSNRLVVALVETEKALNGGKGSDLYELHYLKFKILSLISSDNKLKDSIVNARSRSLESLRKALELDRQKTVSVLISDSYKPVFNLYTEGFQEGVYQFNTGRFKQAYHVFKKTGEIGELIHANGWGLSKFDTTLIFYAAIAAYKGDMINEAFVHFRQLADAGIRGKPEWVSPYQFMAKYHFDRLKANGNKSGSTEADFMKYAELGMQHYPGNEYIPMLITQFYREKKDTTALFSSYRKLISKNSASFQINMEYANDLFILTHLTGQAQYNTQYQSNCQTIETLYNRAISIKPDAFDARLGLAKHFYNQILVVEKDKNATSLKQYRESLIDRSIPLLEKTFDYLEAKTSLSEEERKDFQSTYQMLLFSVEQKNNQQLKAHFEKRFSERLKN